MIILGLSIDSPAWSRDLFRTIGGVTTMDFAQDRKSVV